MRLKTDDLKMLMDYMEKELVTEVEVEVVSANFATHFTFKDDEDRECVVTIYASMREMPPDLTKKMQLQTRIKKGET